MGDAANNQDVPNATVDSPTMDARIERPEDVPVRRPDADAMGNGEDVVTVTDLGPVQDATQEAGQDVAQMDANNCPPTAPMNMSMCSMAMQRCEYSDPSMFTSCTCMGGTWQCFTAVPGPLPPPELC